MLLKEVQYIKTNWPIIVFMGLGVLVAYVFGLESKEFASFVTLGIMVAILSKS